MPPYWLDMENIELKKFIGENVTASDYYDAILLEPGENLYVDGQEAVVLSRCKAFVEFQGKHCRFCLSNWELVCRGTGDGGCNYKT